MRSVAILAAIGLATVVLSARGRVEFTDVTAASGIKFTHTSGASGKKWLPETMGSGAACSRISAAESSRM